MRRAITTALLSGTLLLAVAAPARAESDCPPGSISKTEDGFGWCEPTVCANDASCKANEVCRPVALCMEVGTLADSGTADGGKRLVVTGRCVAGEQPGDPKTCPQKQTCSEMSRCVTKAAAERLGLLAGAPSAAPSAGAAAEAKRSSCGCDVVGAPSGRQAALAFGLVAIGLARRLSHRRGGASRRGCRPSTR